MKILLCTLGMVALTFASVAQTQDRKWGASIGGGSQDYRSNLGNGFKLSGKTSWHGAVVLQVGTYLDKSFDLLFFGAIGDLSASRLKSVGLVLKYKLANGYLLEESSKLKPYVYAGGAFNNLKDSIRKKSSVTDNYLSLNGGLGVRYYVTTRIHIGYNMAIGYFLIESTASISEKRTNEMFLHNALMLGIDL